MSTFSRTANPGSNPPRYDPDERGGDRGRDRERDRDRERQRQRDRDRDREREINVFKSVLR